MSATLNERPKIESRIETKIETALHWCAAFTNSHHEKRVASHCAERNIEAFLPLYRATRRWKNRCEMTLELPLFANYIFVRIDPRQRLRILEVPGVLSLVGSERNPARLPDYEIDALRSSLSQRRIEPHPYLVIGERVRIKTGALAGMEGVLLRKKNAFRVVLALDAILRSVAVEVDAGDVEPVTTGLRNCGIPGLAETKSRRNLINQPTGITF